MPPRISQVCVCVARSRNKSHSSEPDPASDIEVSERDSDEADMQESAGPEIQTMANWEAKAEAHIAAGIEAKVPELVNRP